jgi:hypothetical protein
MITDTSAVKPADWLENEPETIPDPEAEKPEEWDVSLLSCQKLSYTDSVGRGRWRLDPTYGSQPQV